MVKSVLKICSLNDLLQATEEDIYRCEEIVFSLRDYPSLNAQATKRCRNVLERREDDLFIAEIDLRSLMIQVLADCFTLGQEIRNKNRRVKEAHHQAYDAFDRLREKILRFYVPVIEDSAKKGHPYREAQRGFENNESLDY